MKKIISIVGARPQFIKAATVCKKIRANGFQEIFIHTGQHYDAKMSEIFFKELALPLPDYYLGVGSRNHSEQTGRMLIEIEKALLKERPDIVLVYGDTNTTLAGALASVKLNIPVGHIEAGLRSYNKTMPEEVNRVLTDHSATILFCPTEIAVQNLKKEGFSNIFGDGNLSVTSNLQLLDRVNFHISQPLVINVGDVMYDLAMETKDQISDSAVLNRYGLEPNNFVLATIHRADNTDKKENLQNIFLALTDIAQNGMPVIFPVHPRTKKTLEKFSLLNDDLPHSFYMSEPISYKDMLAVEKNARLVITDSGGVQKESYFFKTPCVIPRDETEWVELLDNGWAILTGAERERIVRTVTTTWNINQDRKWKPFYGDGKAAERIVSILGGYCEQL